MYSVYSTGPNNWATAFLLFFSKDIDLHNAWTMQHLNRELVTLSCKKIFVIQEPPTKKEKKVVAERDVK